MKKLRPRVIVVDVHDKKVDVYDKKVWQMFLEIKGELPPEFTPNDVVHLIHRKRPEVKTNTIRTHMIGCTPNHPSHSQFSLPHDIFYHLQRGQYRLWRAQDTCSPTENVAATQDTQEPREPLHEAGKEVVLNWQRFPEFIEARTKFARVPCVYVQTDKEGKPIRIGKASKGMQSRYWGGTGYTVGAAMHNAGNFVFVAPVAESICGDVESELIWRERAALQFNNVGKKRPPKTRLLIQNAGDQPIW